MAIQSFEKAFVSDNEPFVIFRSGGRRFHKTPRQAVEIEG